MRDDLLYDYERELAYLRRLAQESQALLPPDLGGGMEAHFNSVLQALSKLAQARSSATRRAA